MRTPSLKSSAEIAATAFLLVPGLSRVLCKVEYIDLLCKETDSGRPRDPRSASRPAGIRRCREGDGFPRLSYLQPMRSLAMVLLLGAALLAASPAAAQRGDRFGGYGRGYREAPLPEGLQGDGAGFSFCRLM